MSSSTAQAVLEARRNGYKRTVDAKDRRARRAATSVQLRKNKRAEGLMKRRRQTATAPAAAAAAPTAADTPAVTPVAATTDVRLEEMDKYIALMNSSDPAEMFSGLHALRRLLSREDVPPTRQLVEKGVMPRMVQLLGHSNDKMQLEAAWAITNIASTEYTHLLKTHGAIAPLVKLSRSPHGAVREQAIWCLGNVAGDGAALRDQLLATEGAVQALVLNAQHPGSESMLANVAWTMSNLLRGRPTPRLEVVQPVIHELGRLVGNPCPSVVTDAGWGLSYITDADAKYVDAVVASGALPHLAKMLASADASLIVPALRTVGNIVTGSNNQTQAAVDAMCLPPVARLLGHSKRAIRREAAWALSNVAAGTKPQIKALVATPGFLDGIMREMSSGDWQVRKEAAWVVCNVLTTGSPQDLRKVAEHPQFFGGMAELLRCDDSKIIMIALEGLDACFRVSQELMDQAETLGVDKAAFDWVMRFEEVGGVDQVENLQQHRDADVYRKAVSLIESRLGADGEDEEDEEDEGAAEQDAAATLAFAFSQPTPAAASENAAPAVANPFAAAAAAATKGAAPTAAPVANPFAAAASANPGFGW